MVEKRPFKDGESYEVSCKLPRHEEHCHQLPVFHGNDSSKYYAVLAYAPGEEWPTKRKVEVEQKLTGDSTLKPLISTEEGVDYGEEEIELEGCYHPAFAPEYYSFNNAGMGFNRRDDTYSLLLRYPPQKPVPIGPDYQADLPPWSQQGSNSKSSYLDASNAISDSDLVAEGEDDERFLGTCIIPMPASEESEGYDDKAGAGRTDCSCKDKGSIRCVRQHIVEVRDSLRSELKNETFLESGCHDMGERVAEEWSDEEEQLFHEVVFSNLSSMGKNFWDNLSFTFPSRTKMEIVSYYFNVFMLQKRAEQNRFDPVNIDSDNDEWQASDEDDEDSVVESPNYAICHGYERTEDDINEVDEGSAEEVCDEDDEDDLVTLKTEHADCDAKITGSKKWMDGPSSHLLANTACDERDHQDGQDDSCTSFDSYATPLPGTQSKRDLAGSFQSLDGEGGHDYVLETCDTKLWDAAYMACPKSEFEFLPTCSMIEEVFGDGSWTCEPDGKTVR